MIEMNRTNKYCIPLVVLLVCSLINMGHAQSHYDSAYVALAKSRPEKLFVFTDRSLYAVNESIQFSATLQSGAESLPGPGSEVLYVELVNTKGEALVKGKYLLSENRSAGQLSIPSSLPSGNYYLRSYTRWMRNFGAGDLTYIPIRVVNPFSKEVAEESSGTGKAGLNPVQKGSPEVLFLTTRPTYGVGALVEIEIALMEGSISQVQHACLTVVPAGSIDTSAFLHHVDSKPDIPEPFQFNFLPDRNGTAISGTVVANNSGESVSDTRIHFSILGEDPAYLVSTSDQEGRFLLKIPSRLGNQEMFVVPEQGPDQSLEVRIANDFTTEALPFSPGSYALREDEKLLASRLSLQMQLQLAFLAESAPDTSTITNLIEPIPFYGRPEISIKLDEFVSLPNMEEVIENLIPLTYVIQRGGKADFLIKSDNPMISMYRPLILIDHIPVFDMDVVLALPPSKIDRIEVIREVYVLGDVKFGGIICFTSRQGDLAGMKLPEGSYFFDYTTLHPPLLQLDPRYSGGSRIPDTRNTLLWMDDLKLQKSKSSKVSFQAASIPGSYLILFRGVSSDGEIVHGMNSFRVE
jgi:hypothetical protein